MSGNAQKTPLVTSLSRFQEAGNEEMQALLGKAVPASVVSVNDNKTIVTVRMELKSDFTIPLVTCPVGFPEYIRFPIEAGVLGLVISADYYMGGMSGLGGGVASLARQANLSTCVFWPVGNTSFLPSPFPRAAVLYGPDGAVLSDGKETPEVKIRVDGEGNVLLWGFNSISYDCHGYGDRLTWTGGNTFRRDTYYVGATVTVVPHDYNPPEIPPP